MAEELKKTGLMDGMGEGDDDDFNKRHKNKDKIVRCITVNGQSRSDKERTNSEAGNRASVR